MPLQEPVLRAVSFAFGWDLPPRFPDMRGTLTDILRGALDVKKDWSWDSGPDGPMVFAWNDEARLHALATPQGLDLVSEKPEAGKLAETAAASLADCLSTLHLDQVQRCAAAAAWTLAAEQPQEASQGLEAWLGGAALRRKLESLGGRPDDLIFSFRFGPNDGVVTTLRAEPVTDKQAANGPFFLSEMDPSEFAPASLYVHVERSHDGDFSPAEALERAGRHLEHVYSQGNKLLATVNSDDSSREAPT